MADNVPMSEAEDRPADHDDKSTVDKNEWPTGEGEPHQRYRYRDSSGLIYGPMGMNTLVGLIAEQQEVSGDRVSVDGGDWRALDAVDGLHEALDKGLEQLEQEHAAKEAETFEEARDSLDMGPPPSNGDTVRAPAPPPEQVDQKVGDQSSTVPEDSDLARELEAAVSSLEQLSRGLGESSPTAGDDAPPQTIPFEISSGVFTDGEGIDEASVVNEMPAGQEALADATTADDETTNQAIAELREQYASYEGELAQVPFARILARLHRSNGTGRLHVQDGSIEKSIFMREGEPILVDSNKKDELLGAFLLRRKRITQDQLDDALARLSEWGGRLGDALVAIGAIEAHDIFELLSEQMREKLLDVFTWSSGTYGYYENQEPDTMGYPLGIDTYSTIVQACRQEIPVDLINQFYQGRRNVSIFKINRPAIDVDRLKLSARELRVLTQLDAGTNLRTLIDNCEEDRKELALRTIYLLHQVEVLKFETTDKVELPGD